MGRPLSIVHINTHDILGGASKVAWRLAEEQRRLGHEALVLCGYRTSPSEYAVTFPADADPDLHERRKNEGLLYYEFQGSHRLLCHPAVARADIVHLHNLHGDFFNPYSLALLARHKKVVWTLHDMQAITGHCAHSFTCEKWRTGCGDCPDLGIYPAIGADATARLWQDKQWIYRNSPGLSVITPSAWLGEKVQTSMLGERFSGVIPNGVDTAVFRPYDRAAVRRALGLPGEALLIGCVAHAGALANPWKGGRYALAAMEALWERHPDAYFLNIGGESGMSHPRIIDVGRVEDETELARVYSSLDIFLFTSLAENCPLVILEAMACGIPVVSFATGGVPELLRTGMDGVVAGYRNLQELVTSLTTLASDEGLRNACGKNARIHAETTFQHQLITQAYIDHYENLPALPPAAPLDMPSIPEIIRTQLFATFAAVEPNRHAEALRLAREGEDLFSRGNVAEAEQVFQAAAEISPAAGIARNDLAVLGWQAGQHQAMLSEFAAAATLAPWDAAIVDNLVQALLRLGEEQTARMVEEAYGQHIFPQQKHGNP